MAWGIPFSTTSVVELILPEMFDGESKYSLLADASTLTLSLSDREPHAYPAYYVLVRSAPPRGEVMSGLLHMSSVCYHHSASASGLLRRRTDATTVFFPSPVFSFPCNHCYQNPCKMVVLFSFTEPRAPCLQSRPLIPALQPSTARSYPLLASSNIQHRPCPCTMSPEMVRRVKFSIPRSCSRNEEQVSISLGAIKLNEYF